MAEMRASPVKSKALKRLADIVRSVEQGGQMEILPFNPATLFPVSSTTLENLAYGNLPMAIPSQSNIPITKTGRKQEVAELAGLLPTLPAASRGVAQGANYLGDVLTQAVTRNPQATSMRALDEISRMSPVPQVFDPALAKRVMPKTAIVDETGNPLLMYHGTNKEITDFLQTGKPTYLSTDPEFSSYYATAKGGNIIPAYVNAKKTWDYQNPKDLKAFQKYLGLTEKDLESPQGFDEGEQYLAAARGQWDFIEGKEFQKFLKNKGYDSFYVVENGSRNIGVFDPQQVKSAISDPDIMEQFLSSSKTPIAGLVEPQVGATKKLTRSEIQAEAKSLGLPSSGKTEEIQELINIVKSDPRTWTQEQYTLIRPHLAIHQDFRPGSAERSESIMREGLRSGMVDYLEPMEKGQYSFAKGLVGSDAYLFPTRGLKFKSASDPHLAPGNIPLFRIKPEKGQSVYEAIVATAERRQADDALEQFLKGK